MPSYSVAGQSQARAGDHRGATQLSISGSPINHFPNYDRLGYQDCQTIPAGLFLPLAELYKSLTYEQTAKDLVESARGSWTPMG